MREYGGLSLKPASSKHIMIRCLLYYYNKHADVVITMLIEGGSGSAGVYINMITLISYIDRLHGVHSYNL